mgnify:CR=1 FL=1
MIKIPFIAKGQIDLITKTSILKNIAFTSRYAFSKPKDLKNYIKKERKR